MDLKQIHDLIKVVNKSNIGEISVEDKDGKVTIKQKEEAAVTYTSAPSQAVYVTAASSFCLMVTLPSLSSILISPMLLLLTILINS